MVHVVDRGRVISVSVGPLPGTAFGLMVGAHIRGQRSRWWEARAPYLSDWYRNRHRIAGVKEVLDVVLATAPAEERKWFVTCLREGV